MRSAKRRRHAAQGNKANIKYQYPNLQTANIPIASGPGHRETISRIIGLGGPGHGETLSRIIELGGPGHHETTH